MAYDFASLKSRVQDRLLLPSTTAATRIGKYINERYRAVATSIGMQAVRFGTENIVTVNGTPDYTTTNLIHLMTLTYTAGNRVMDEVTYDDIRNLDPGGIRTGSPELYVKKKFNNANLTITIWPTPDAIYTLPGDGILRGAELVNDNDVPVLPEDFEDILIFGACADELIKLEKPALAAAFEAKFVQRQKDLRFFIAKTAYLETRQGDGGQWWWGPWFHNYRGFWN